MVDDDGGERVDIRPVGMLAHSFDHRAVDGAYSGAYLRLVKRILESREWLGEFFGWRRGNSKSPSVAIPEWLRSSLAPRGPARGAWRVR